MISTANFLAAGDGEADVIRRREGQGESRQAVHDRLGRIRAGKENTGQLLVNVMKIMKLWKPIQNQLRFLAS